MRCSPGKALLWQQGLVWDVGGSAASPPSIGGWRRASPGPCPRCLPQQPVLLAVPADSISHRCCSCGLPVPPVPPRQCPARLPQSCFGDVSPEGEKGSAD